MASVKLNGKDLGILWKPPYCADVTGVLDAPVPSGLIGPVNLRIAAIVKDY
jgi:hypothetical protein